MGKGTNKMFQLCIKQCDRATQHHPHIPTSAAAAYQPGPHLVCRCPNEVFSCRPITALPLWSTLDHYCNNYPPRRDSTHTHIRTAWHRSSQCLWMRSAVSTWPQTHRACCSRGSSRSAKAMAGNTTCGWTTLADTPCQGPTQGGMPLGSNSHQHAQCSCSHTCQMPPPCQMPGLSKKAVQCHAHVHNSPSLASAL